MIKLIYPKFWQTKNIISYALWPFSLIYQIGTLLRKIFSTKISLPAKVICVGNITVGGTGKTQIVIWLAKLLSLRKVKFVIIAKGYKGTTSKAILVSDEHNYKQIGDEAILLKDYGPTIVTKKIKNARTLLSELKPEVIIVDDGMQNPSFHKDLIITVIDGHRVFGNEFILPAGPLRETIEAGLSKAEILITMNDNSGKSAQRLAEISATSQMNTQIKPIFDAKMVAHLNLDKNRRYIAFTGIGNPERFFMTLKDHGLMLADGIIFQDHHDYSAKDLDFLKQKAAKERAILITTTKDYVKIPPQELELIRFDVELEFMETEKLTNMIYEKIF